MRVLVVSQFFVPDITAAAFRIADHATLIAEAGHDVQVITAVPHKGDAGDGESEPVPENVIVHRCHIRPVKKKGTLSYLRHYWSFVYRSAWRGLMLRLGGWRADVVYISSPPLFVGLTGRFLSVIFRCPMVFEIRDVWPDSAVAAGMISKQGRAYRIGRGLETYLYCKASHITCVARPMQDYLRAETSTPITVVYNGVRRESDSVRPREVAGVTKTILYAGNLGHVQDLDLLIRGFGELSQAGKIVNWNLRLIGAGAQEDNLRNLIREKRLVDVISIEAPLPRDEVAEQMRQADLLYMNLKKDNALAKTIPSKLFDYLLASRPILAGIAGEGCEILNSTKANICFEPSDLDALQSALIEATERFYDLDQAAHENRSVVLENYTRECAVETLLRVFQKVLSDRDHRAAAVNQKA